MNILSNSTLYQVHYLTHSTAIVSGEDVSFALECGLPTEVIKAQGDWASKDCKNYVNPSLGMCQGILQQLWKTMCSSVCVV